MECIDPECGRKDLRGQGMCNMHYHRWYRAGNATPRPADWGRRNCGFPSCEKPHQSTGYCDAHYRQHKKGQELSPLKQQAQPHPRSSRNAAGEKRCSGCRKWLPEVNFHRSVSSSDGLKSECKECRREHVADKHGVSRAWYEAMTAKGCRICGTTSDLKIDHDHDCCPGPLGCAGCVRGILCGRHNTGLGMFADNTGHLVGAVHYLEGHRAKVGLAQRDGIPR